MVRLRKREAGPLPRRVIKGLAAVVVLGAALVLNAAAPSAHRSIQDVDWTPVGQAIGIPGSLQSGDVYRVDLPRTDLKVHIPANPALGIDKVHIKPAFALGGYLVFMSTGADMQAMVMGDLVLTEDEIEPVMLALEQHGIQITAIHNHLLWERPTVMYVHVMGMGDASAARTDVPRRARVLGHAAHAIDPQPG
jgi:hypothetical protein